MKAKAIPFLMFQGKAEEAIQFYASLFDDGEILEVRRYGPEGPAPEGTFMLARLRLAGLEVTCFESPAKHEFDFTPSFSLFVDCQDNEELERLVAALGEGGSTLMPLDNYGFSKRYAWLNDRFGVSWQLNLP